MSWTIELRDRVAIVTMNTNTVNAQNQEFFADLHEAFDTLESEHPRSPVVLTGTATRFSAGLDLDEHFRLFERDRDEVAEWFAGYRETNMRLFTYPRPMVAAVNGHAFAGGLITASVCDRRVCVDQGAKFGINEVPIGIPMPAVYLRMLQYAWGEPIASRVSLQGQIYTVKEVCEMGIMHELRPADEVLDRAVEIADMTPDDCIDDYAYTKRALQAPALRDIASLSDPQDEVLADGMTSVDSRHAHRRYWETLKGRPANW